MSFAILLAKAFCITGKNQNTLTAKFAKEKPQRSRRKPVGAIGCRLFLLELRQYFLDGLVEVGGGVDLEGFSGGGFGQILEGVGKGVAGPGDVVEIEKRRAAWFSGQQFRPDVGDGAGVRSEKDNHVGRSIRREFLVGEIGEELGRVAVFQRLHGDGAGFDFLERARELQERRIVKGITAKNLALLIEVECDQAYGLIRHLPKQRGNAFEEKHAVPGAKAGLVGIDGGGIEQNSEPEASTALRWGNVPRPAIKGLHDKRIDGEVHMPLGAIGSYLDFPVLSTRAAAVVHDEDVDGVATFANRDDAAQSEFLFQFVGSICHGDVWSDRGQTVA